MGKLLDYCVYRVYSSWSVGGSSIGRFCCNIPGIFWLIRTQRMISFRTILTSCFLLFFSFALQAGFEEGEEANRKGDRATAFKEFQAASQAGDTRAYSKLGSMYLYGLGTETNYPMAYAWFALGMQAGDRYAERFRDTAAAAMPLEQIRHAEELLSEYRAKLGLPEPASK
jgi:hypothetical protein